MLTYKFQKEAREEINMKKKLYFYALAIKIQKIKVKNY